MPNYRVEVTERRVITRETWIEADSAARARTLVHDKLVLGDRWKGWQEVCGSVDEQIDYVEAVDDPDDNLEPKS